MVSPRDPGTEDLIIKTVMWPLQNIYTQKIIKIYIHIILLINIIILILFTIYK